MSTLNLRTRDELVHKMLEIQADVVKASCLLPSRDYEECLKKVRALAMLEGKLALLEWLLIRDDKRKVDA